MAVTDRQRLQKLEAQVKFLQQRINPGNSAAVAALAVAVAAINTALYDENEPDFFYFGRISTKGNNAGRAGYDWVRDETTLGGYARIITYGDTPNVALIRGDFEATVTGFPDNTTIARFGAIPVGLDREKLWDNGSDGEAMSIAARLHIGDNGDDPSVAYGQWVLAVISDDGAEPKVPETKLTWSGQSRGMLVASGFLSDGTTPFSEVIWQAP